MGYEEGCKQVGVFLEGIADKVEQLPKPETEVQKANASQLMSAVDMLGAVAGKLRCPEWEEHQKNFTRARTDLQMKLMGLI